MFNHPPADRAPSGPPLRKGSRAFFRLTEPCISMRVQPPQTPNLARWEAAAGSTLEVRVAEEAASSFSD